MLSNCGAGEDSWESLGLQGDQTSQYIIYVYIYIYTHTYTHNIYYTRMRVCSVASVMSDSSQAHGQQDARLPCPSPSPRVCLNSCPLSQWCHPTISSCHPLLLLPSIFPSMWVFSNESVLCIRWPKYWRFSFGISPSVVGNIFHSQIETSRRWSSCYPVSVRI